MKSILSTAMAMACAAFLLSACSTNQIEGECESYADCPEGQMCDMTNHICISRCEAQSCLDLDKQCGEWDDGCGTQLACGECGNGQTCSESGACEGTCQPSTCLELSKECGTWDDGCDGQVVCDPCAPGWLCNEQGVCEEQNLDECGQADLVRAAGMDEVCSGMTEMCCPCQCWMDGQQVPESPGGECTCKEPTSYTCSGEHLSLAQNCLGDEDACKQAEIDAVEYSCTCDIANAIYLAAYDEYCEGRDDECWLCRCWNQDHQIIKIDYIGPDMVFSCQPAANTPPEACEGQTRDDAESCLEFPGVCSAILNNGAEQACQDTAIMTVCDEADAIEDQAAFEACLGRDDECWFCRCFNMGMIVDVDYTGGNEPVYSCVPEEPDLTVPCDGEALNAAQQCLADPEECSQMAFGFADTECQFTPLPSPCALVQDLVFETINDVCDDENLSCVFCDCWNQGMEMGSGTNADGTTYYYCIETPICIDDPGTPEDECNPPCIDDDLIKAQACLDNLFQCLEGVSYEANMACEASHN